MSGMVVICSDECDVIVIVIWCDMMVIVEMSVMVMSMIKVMSVM